MTKPERKVIRTASVFVCGIGVGWLIGLSYSPVIQVVITSIITLVASITSALAGMRSDPNEHQARDDAKPKRKLQFEINPYPMMLMIIGVALGASVGIYARANNWLGVRPNKFVEQWRVTGLSDNDISKRLFDDLHPDNTSSSAEPNKNLNASSPEGEKPLVTSNNNQTKTDSSGKNNKPNAATNNSVTSKPEGARPEMGVLFVASEDECDSMRTDNDQELGQFLSNYRDKNVRDKARQCPDAKCLRAIVEAICYKRK